MKINERGKWEVFGGFNPKLIPFSFNIDVIPHVKTVRISYIVPKGRRAIVRALFADALQTAAATARLDRKTGFDFKPSNGEKATIHEIIHLANSTTPGAGASMPFEIYMEGGDLIEGFTLNLSTGGTMVHTLIANIIEFDI